MVHRRRLRTELRKARARTKLTQEQVASAMDWSLSKIIRIETGSVGISTNDLRALLDLYGINTVDQVNELIELARLSRLPSWWSKYRGDISNQFMQFLEYEEAASVMRAYEPLLLPGLTQTEQYSSVIMHELAFPDASEQMIQSRIEIRLSRQQLLEMPDPPTLIYVVDESAIQHLLGENSAAKDQLARLIDLAQRPNIEIEVVPFSQGLHRGMLEPFLILEFPDPEDNDVVFLESSRDMIFTNDEAGEITGYREVFEHLRSISIGPEGTLEYFKRLAQSI
jgi:transcriptional regulator with XRE-family HTH domain